MVFRKDSNRNIVNVIEDAQFKKSETKLDNDYDEWGLVDDSVRYNLSLSSSSSLITPKSAVPISILNPVPNDDFLAFCNTLKATLSKKSYDELITLTNAHIFDTSITIFSKPYSLTATTPLTTVTVSLTFSSLVLITTTMLAANS
ncbi:hypothetical protein AGMMS49921_01600 [Endomicrobiia bacterium]|nr:hypothetical protein AGMMS49921_01600 [Endomicrobiia bacterium]